LKTDNNSETLATNQISSGEFSFTAGFTGIPKIRMYLVDIPQGSSYSAVITSVVLSLTANMTNAVDYGNTYKLVAKDGTDTYFSESTLNSPTSIDSFTYSYKERGSFGGPKGNYITLWAKDKVGKGDFYWFRLFRNDSLQSKVGDILIAQDNSTTSDGKGDGDLFIVPIRDNFTSRPFLSGENARIEILSITPELYYYLNLISTQLNNTGLFAVPPSNIPSNIICVNDQKKKVLGFFSMAGKVSTQKLLIK
jgi:hypothetical protein